MYGPLDILSFESWVLFGTIIVLIRQYVHRKFQVLKKLNIPHDRPSLWNLGNLRTQLLKKPDKFFEIDLEMMEKYGSIYGTYNGLAISIVISDPDILRKVMIKEFSTFPDRQKVLLKISGKEMNTGLTAVRGSQWRRIRHTLSPTFSSSKLKAMISIIENCSDVMVKNLRSKVEKHNGIFETKDVFGSTSLDTITSAAFGVNVHSQDDNGEEAKVIIMAKKLFSTSLFKPIFFLFMLFPSTENIAEYFNYTIFPKDALSYFSSLTEAVIKSKKDPATETKTDIMESMLVAEITESEARHKTKGMTRIEIEGNSLLMLLAGYETTSGAMTFLAYNLAYHKKAQNKLRQEIKDCFEKYGALNYEALNAMTYLMQCLNEALRLYPPVARNIRYCEKDITIDGITIPKGTHVDIPTFGMARSEKFWDEPLKYKPERMEDMSKIDPLVFQPFGAGPRNCIGMRFALMEIKMVFCKILLNFELDVAPDTPKPPLEIIFKASMRPKADKVHLRVIPLNMDSTVS